MATLGFLHNGCLKVLRIFRVHSRIGSAQLKSVWVFFFGVTVLPSPSSPAYNTPTCQNRTRSPSRMISECTWRLSCFLVCRDAVALDPKYFQRTNPPGETPHLPRTDRTSPNAIHFSTSNPSRLSKDAIVPKLSTAVNPNPRAPLSSAYFPAGQANITWKNLLA